MNYPKIIMSSTYSDIKGISEKKNEGLWEYTRKNTDGWKHHVNRIGHPEHKIPDNIFEGIINRMKENNISMVIETKSVYKRGDAPFEEAGLFDARRDIEYLSRVRDYGYTCHSIEFDGAFFDYTNAGMTEEQAGKAVTDYFREMKKEFPETDFFLLFNLPNWGWKGRNAYRTENNNPLYMGDAYRTFMYISELMKKEKIHIEGVVIDNPYDYATGDHKLIESEKTMEDVKSVDWLSDILEFEKAVKSLGMKFYMIFNSQNGGDTDSKRFYDETLKYISLYYKSGGAPDGAEIQSWYKKPEDYLPEDSELTVTGLTKSSIKLIRELLS